VREADLVCLATPVMALPALLTAIAPHLKPGAVVTDLCSTKAQAVFWARQLLPAGVHVVGGHPMAGSERAGVAHAQAGLLTGAPYLVTPDADAPESAIALVERLARDAGAVPVRMDPLRHDEGVAGASHLPFLLSVALVHLTTRDPNWPDTSKLASSGYRDVSRLASGNAAMYQGICLTNAAAIRPWLQETRRFLGELAENLEDPEYLARLFTESKTARDAWLAVRWPSADPLEEIP
jgi:prephenate dehydrogenase